MSNRASSAEFGGFGDVGLFALMSGVVILVATLLVTAITAR
jgi:hypothetical protein